MKKIVIICITLCSGFFSHAQTTNPNEHIGALLNQGNWFAVNEYFEKESANLDDFLRLFSETLLDYYFNDPEGVVEKVQILNEKYGEQLGSNSFALHLMMAESLSFLGNSSVAWEICNSIISQAANYMDQGTLEAYRNHRVLYNWLKNRPSMTIGLATADTKVQLQFADDDISFPVKINALQRNAMLDSGCNITAVNSSLAKALEMEISQDSMAVNDIYAPIGIIDTLCIGSSILTNVPCTIMPDNPIHELIIGAQVLRHFSKMEIDYEKESMTLYNSKTGQPSAKRNLMFDKMFYFSADVNGANSILLWDTGSNKNLLCDKFYLSNQENFPAIREFEKKEAISTSGTYSVSYAELGNITIKLNDSTRELPFSVVKELPLFNWLSTPADGLLGCGKIKNVGKLIVDFQNMHIKVQ